MAKYAIGLDYGTNSVRALIVNVANGREVATAVWNYAHGDQGRHPVARPEPRAAASGGLRHRARRSRSRRRWRRRSERCAASSRTRSSASAWIPRAARRCRWIATGQPLAFDKRFAKNPAAMAWLWKDHTGVAEAAEITALARKIRPQYLAKCGGTYSQRMVLQQDPALPADQPRGVRRRPLVGGMRRLGAGDAHRHRGAGQTDRRRLRRRPQGDV